MITRIWHGRTSLANADDYLNFLLHKGTKGYTDTEGILTVKVWRAYEADCCHFYTVTEWENLEAVIRFAGADYEKAVYYPEDEGILLEFEEKVKHCETYPIEIL